MDKENPREKVDVAPASKAAGTAVHFGGVFDICVEKNIYLLGGTPGRKIKGRAVYQGNNVRDQGGSWARFEDFEPCPSTTAASNMADIYSLLRGHAGERADAEMASTQAASTGPETWMELPEEQRPQPSRRI